MSRSLKTTITILFVMVVMGLITLPSLRRAIERISSGMPKTEEQARHEVMQVPVSTPTDAKATAQMYWLSASSLVSLDATPIQLSLSADPVERSKQLLISLMGDAPAERRTLPSDATLLAFYMQPDGTAIADFSDALQQETPSGILSEELAVDSITQTLAANVQGIRRLKILIHGQTADTLSGHLDLSGFFPVPTGMQTTATQAAAIQSSTAQTPATQAVTPVPQAAGAPGAADAVQKNPAPPVPAIPASTK